MPDEPSGQPEHLTITLPEFCVVLLVGPAGAGKSTFARQHFKPTEILSSDFFRGMVCDDEANQGATRDAFDLLHRALEKRLARRRLTVIDATNLAPEARKPLLDIARRYFAQVVAIVFHLPLAVVLEQNRRRAGRIVEPEVVEWQHGRVAFALAQLKTKRIHKIYTLTSPEEVSRVQIVRERLPNNRRHDTGPFDIIGDVHGCFEELTELLQKLGYDITTADAGGERHYRVRPPDGRKLIFVGDLVDRGPLVAEVLRLVMDAAAEGVALCVIGNHDDKLRRKLEGKNVNLTHGLAETLHQLDRESPAFRERVCSFLKELPIHLVLDHGKLVVAHAGLPRTMHGRESGEVRSFALYGDTTGEIDPYGLPVRRDWAANYDGRAAVVYGHTPVAEPRWVNGTINIDTGCCFGGSLTALRWPELELVSVPAKREYTPAIRPFLPRHFAEQRRVDGDTDRGTTPLPEGS